MLLKSMIIKYVHAPLLVIFLTLSMDNVLLIVLLPLVHKLIVEVPCVYLLQMETSGTLSLTPLLSKWVVPV